MRTTFQDQTFDRQARYDTRSRGYPLRPLLDTGPVRSKTWRSLALNQNFYDCPVCRQYGACTGFSTTMEAAARPAPAFGDPGTHKHTPEEIEKIESLAHAIYHRAKQLDYWAGEDYEGSSVLAAVQAGVEQGWFTHYRWALGPGADRAAEDVMRGLQFGPILVGSWWYEEMMNADSAKYLALEGERVGGHAYVLTAVNRIRDAVYTPNSWGGAGAGWIKRVDLIRLLDEDGEAVLPYKPTKGGALSRQLAELQLK